MLQVRVVVVVVIAYSQPGRSCRSTMAP